MQLTGPPAGKGCHACSPGMGARFPTWRKSAKCCAAVSARSCGSLNLSMPSRSVSFAPGPFVVPETRTGQRNMVCGYVSPSHQGSPKFCFFNVFTQKTKGDTVSPLSPFVARPASILKHACSARVCRGAEPVEGRSIWRGWLCQPSPPSGRESFPSGDQCPAPAASAESSSSATILVILIIGLTAGPAVSL